MSGFFYSNRSKQNFALTPEAVREIHQELLSFLEAQGRTDVIKFAFGDKSTRYLNPEKYSDPEFIFRHPNSKDCRIDILNIAIYDQLKKGQRESDFSLNIFFESRNGEPDFHFSITDRTTRSNHQAFVDRVWNLMKSTIREDTPFTMLPRLHLGPFIWGGLLLGLYFLRKSETVKLIKLGDLNLVDFVLFEAGLVVILILALMFSKPIQMLHFIENRFPIRGAFLWGAEIHAHPHRVSVQQGIFWTVIIGSLISVLTGIVLFFVLPK